MTTPTLSNGEARRLAALEAYAVIETPPEEAFDDLTRLAAQVCGTPIALIGFATADRYWIKSRLGLAADYLPRETSFCAQVLELRDLFVVEDAREDPRFASHPFVVAGPHIRFYAGMPLITPRHGEVIGTLCVMDTRPRPLTVAQAEGLRILSHQVLTHLELRRNLRELEVSVASHLRTEEALRLTEAKYRDIFEHVMEGIFQSTPEGVYLSANPALARIYGYDSADQLLAAVSDIQRQVYVQPGRRDEFKRQILREDLVTGFESQVFRKDGSTIWVSESARVVRDAEGHILYFEGTVQDITEHRRAEQALAESELLYHSLVEALPQNLFRKDHRGRFTFANRRFCDQLGRPLDAIVGRTDYDFFPPELAAKYQADDQRVMESRKPMEAVEEHATPDGGKLYVQVVKTPLFDATGGVTGVQGMFWDVTERYQMEQALAYERDLLRTLFDNIPDAIYFKDLQSRFLRIGRAQAQRFGLRDPEEGVGRTDADFFSSEHALGAYADEQTIIRTGQPIIGKVERETWPGRKDTWVLTTKMPLRSRAGEIIGTFGISKDITQLKEAEAELGTARDAALESARLKAEFLANMSHEIRTPMNCIIGMTGLLLETPLTDEQRDFSETIRGSADSLLVLINDILDFSKFEAGRLEIEPIDFDLLETIEGTVELLAERADSKGLELVSWVQEDIPHHVRGDPGRIRQVLTNLLGNAIKFTEQGEVVVRLSKVSESPEGALVRFEVTDTGIGVAAEVRDRLFKAFSQADGSLTRKYGGTGLGLAISKQLVELMGGHIGLVSTPGQGSTFWFSLPLATSPAAAPAPGVSSALRGLRVLIVDDHPTTCAVLSEMTTAWGMLPTVCDHGARALELLEEAAQASCGFDLALIDLHLQDVEGLSLAQQVRARPALAGVRLVILTSMTLHLDSQAWRGVGVDGYQVKPVRQSRLQDTLLLALGREPLSAEARARDGDSRAPLELRVLLAEDNVVNQKIALRQLKKLGCAAEAVANGMEAIEAVRRIPYDVVLMDCQMPELDGYEATRRIRQLEADLAATGRKPVHIIAMTANALGGDRRACIEAGMNDYISKPVKLPSLQAALRKVRRTRATPDRPPRPPSPAPAEESAVDPETFASLRALQEPGEPDAVKEICELFLQDTPPRLEAIRRTLQTGVPDAIRQASHALKGSASNLGARPLAALCARIENAARRDDVAAAREALPALEEEYRRVCFLLEQEAKKQNDAPLSNRMNDRQTG